MNVFVWTEIKVCVYYRLRLQSSSCGRSLRLYCSISVCSRLFTAGWYVLAKGKILSLVLFFCVKADGPAAKLNPERDLSMTVLAACPQVLFEFHKALLKCCF